MEKEEVQQLTVSVVVQQLEGRTQGARLDDDHNDEEAQK